MEPGISKTLLVPASVRQLKPPHMFQDHRIQNQLFLERSSGEPSSLGQLNPLIGPEWPGTEHGRLSTEADKDRPAKKEWQSPVKHSRKKCGSAHIANGGIP
jgi:hypothetical protein